MSNPLASPSDYSIFIHELPERYTSIERSSLVYIALGTQFGKVIGMVFFANNVILCVQEFLNLELQVIEGYGYEVSRSLAPVDHEPSPDEYCGASYPDKEKLYWYDSFPHPHDPTLAPTHPHHKHIPPNIKRNRISAPNLTFTAPNLHFLIEEIEREVLSHQSGLA
jgi:hypothetical protein